MGANLWTGRRVPAGTVAAPASDRRRAAQAEAGEQCPGDTLACGTGANFPYLQERIGPNGRLVGIDYTPAMLEEARRLVAREGWRNVALVHADAASLELEEQFDGVLLVLAASVVPDWQRHSNERWRTSGLGVARDRRCALE